MVAEKAVEVLNTARHPVQDADVGPSSRCRNEWKNPELSKEDGEKIFCYLPLQRIVQRLLVRTREDDCGGSR